MDIKVQRRFILQVHSFLHRREEISMEITIGRLLLSSTCKERFAMNSHYSDESTLFDEARVCPSSQACGFLLESTYVCTCVFVNARVRLSGDEVY